MELIWVYDRTAGSNIGYPNLAQFDARPFTPDWHHFGQHWPGVIPLRFLMYLDHNHIHYRVEETRWAQQGWYPIGINWFDFSIDYFALIPESTRQRIQQGFFRVLFYYHEGDNPQRIQDRLRELSKNHGLENKFILISANTAADFYFDDHECFFRYMNRNQLPYSTSRDDRRDFTALNRANKQWRLSCMADLWREGLLDNSIWSYDTETPSIDSEQDNPISIDTITGLLDAIPEFLAQGPYSCDGSDASQKNDHHYVNESLYHDSYFHIIIETHFDADQSGGTFLTEKTWKCIKYGQPFVMVAPPGSLQHLRNLGYKVFDSVLNNSYDSIQDATHRWTAIKELIRSMKLSGLSELYQQCKDDARWNQRWFSQRQDLALRPMIELLNETDI